MLSYGNESVQNKIVLVVFIQPRPETRLQVRKKNYLHIEKTVSFRFYFRIVLNCSEIYSSVYDLKGTYEFYANYFIQKKLKTFFYFNCFLCCIKPYGVWQLCDTVSVGFYVHIFILIVILIKITSRKIHGLSLKSFDVSAKDYCYVRFQNGSRNMFANTGQKNVSFYFSDNIAKTCSYERENSSNIEMNYLFHFKAYFHVLDTIA